MRIWDFDGVIFNSQGDYTDDFLVINQHNKSLVATLPRIEHEDMLITGRNQLQMDLVKEILQYNNIHFDHMIFSHFVAKDYQSKDFFPKYYQWKKGLILENASDDAEIVDDDAGVFKDIPKNGLTFTHIKIFCPDLRPIVKP